MSDKTYRLKSDLSREQLEGLLDALLPFYGFGTVVECAGDKSFGEAKPGSATVTLYAGKPAETRVNPNGVTWSKIPQTEDYLNEAELEDADPEGCLLGIAGSYPGVAASFMTPVITIGHFLKARDAFLACSETIPRGERAAGEELSA